uniref:HTH_Tnp_Tc3_1 domain-containing protein n=1 Tax=Heterorhabditis bacteriophora TaxID=37862 RepID=A0A1I7WJW4_HETBA
MGRASTLSIHKRGQIKVLSNTGYTVKQISDVVKRSKKSIMNFVPLQEEYDTKKCKSINEIRRTCDTDVKKCPQLTQVRKDESLHLARYSMKCDWKEVRFLRI